MISNQTLSPLVAEILHELAMSGLECLTPTLEKLLNELMLIERNQVLQAAPYERSEQRKGYANGFKNKTLQMRCGKLHLQVPKTRDEPFYPSCLEKGMRSERALQLAIAEMYIKGVSTRKVKKITDKLCDHEVSSSQVSRLTALLDEELKKFRDRPLGKIKYLYLDATYEKARVDGCVRSVAILTAIGVNEEGYREVVGISCSLSEAEVHWRSFLEKLLKRGLCGVELIISDAHTGLSKAREAVLPSVKWQRCLFHLTQNAQHYAKSNQMRGEIADDVRDIYLAASKEEARERLQRVVKKYEMRASEFSVWLEENFEEGLTHYEHPKRERKKLRTNNLSERLNRELRRRARVIGVFPNTESLLRLTTAVVVEIHEGWVSGRKYLG
ncbi:MAG: IS256 family transposase [Candidatus Algichlamydia australiensis]|nr:IS256 family transposase [Chlamydiales bacterium]